jgi:TPR repeat protein
MVDGGVSSIQSDDWALGFFLVAGNTRDARAFYEIGCMYDRGFGIPVNPHISIEWHQHSYDASGGLWR